MNNKFPQITFVYDRHKRASFHRKSSVEMRIAYNYKQKYLSTGIMLYPYQWKKGIISQVPNTLQLSKILETMLTDVRQILYDMMKEGNIDISSIDTKLAKKRQGNLSFMEFCSRRAEIRKYGKAKDSQERYDRFIRLFRTWGKIKQFEDITEHNIIEYDKYLHDKGMKTYSKWNNYHRFLNGFIMDAIKEGYLHSNPYEWININRDRNSPGIDKYLSPTEFRKLKTAEMPTESLERVRDTFVFQTYTCLSYTDLAQFNQSRIQEVKGTKVYIGARQKTNKEYIIPMLSPAIDILNKYGGKLPIISNVKYNEYLKIVAQAAGIDKPISSHWARHTGATLLLNEGVNLKVVSKICGHSSLRITEQIYAKLLDNTIVDAVKDLKI